ncbi:prolipoprotein diacylglyceryl transferase [Psychromicrobium lacuslunae]|uniref:prolipoprotein diacylglyceryl transferase n=1 Tax=Psychromicrobium lacuslunae TaxID=1618207 RepID=UPI00069676C9|nr:prolipoprotein diacylglyceryl transferase [Psychromicrobium lacuslunae]
MSTLQVASAMPASIPSPSWSGFSIPLPWGALTIHAYALAILLGIIAALWLTSVRWKRRNPPEGSLWDIAIWAIPFGIIGGRLYHVFSSPDAYFGPGYSGGGDPWKILRIWEGGLGIWGAVVLGVVGAWIGCRRSGVKVTALIDAAAPGLLLAQAIGRWGNYFNQELFGGPTTLPWGLQVDPNSPNFPAGYAADTLFHPTFLYECLWNLVGVVILLLLDRKFHFRRGRLFWLYAMYYTLGRVWIEALRIDDAEQITFFGITTRLNVWTSILVFLVSLLIFLVLSFVGRKNDATASVMLPGREAEREQAAEEPLEPIAAAEPAGSVGAAGSAVTIDAGGSATQAESANLATESAAAGSVKTSIDPATVTTTEAEPAEVKPVEAEQSNAAPPVQNVDKSSQDATIEAAHDNLPNNSSEVQTSTDSEAETQGGTTDKP